MLGETGHLFSGNRDILFSGNRTTYPLGIGPLILWESGHFLGNGTFYPLGTILSSGNRDTYPLGIGPLILWDSGHPLGNGTWETGHSILWESYHLSSGKREILSSGNREKGNRFLTVPADPRLIALKWSLREEKKIYENNFLWICILDIKLYKKGIFI